MSFIISKTEIQKIENALYIVPTPIGNLKDITIRALEVLSNVNLIAAEDTRKSKILLDNYSIQTPLISFFSHNQNFRTPQLIQKLKSGESIAIVSDAGTPGISDPAYNLIKDAIDEKIKIIPLPGATALIPALVASGLHSHSFLFDGFLPIKKGRSSKLENLKSENRTIIFYESPHRILKTLSDIFENFGNRNVVVVREISKIYEEFIRGNLLEVIQSLKNRPIKGEFVIIVEGTSK